MDKIYRMKKGSIKVFVLTMLVSFMILFSSFSFIANVHAQRKKHMVILKRTLRKEMEDAYIYYFSQYGFDYVLEDGLIVHKESGRKYIVYLEDDEYKIRRRR